MVALGEGITERYLDAVLSFFISNFAKKGF